MIRFKTSDGETFEAPNSLSDITLKKYIEYANFVEPTMPACLQAVLKAQDELAAADNPKAKEAAEKVYQEAIEAITDVVTYKEVLPYYARVISFFTGLSEAKMLGKDGGDGMNVNQLRALYLSIMQVLNNLPEVEYSNVLEYGGELWYLPERYMTNSTVIEFAESAQFQQNFKDLAGGQWAAMSKIMCVLVRKQGEKYSDKLMKREPFFLEWDMLKVWQVAFFLLRRIEPYQLSLQAYTNALRLSKLKRELASSPIASDGI